MNMNHTRALCALLGISLAATAACSGDDTGAPSSSELASASDAIGPSGRLPTTPLDEADPLRDIQQTDTSGLEVIEESIENPYPSTADEWTAKTGFDQKWTPKFGQESWPSVIGVQSFNIEIGNWNTDVCIMRGFRGALRVSADFANISDFVVATRPDGNGKIMMTGNHVQEAYAYCTPRATFSGPNNFWPYQDVRSYGFIYNANAPALESFNFSVEVSYPPSQAGYILSGIGYDFSHSTNDFVNIGNTGLATISAQSPKFTVGFFSPIRLRNTAGVVKLSGTNGTKNASEVFAYSLHSTGPVNKSIYLPYKKATHLCYFKQIRGRTQADSWAILNVESAGANADKWRVDVRGGTDGALTVDTICMPKAQ